MTLVLTFSLTPNLNFRSITGLKELSVLGQTVVMPIGEKNPWTNITHLAMLLLLVFVVDAAMTAWRRERRQQALVLAGIVVFATLVGATLSELLNRGMLTIPFSISIVFLIVVLGMAYELGNDLLRARQISLELRETQQRMSQAASAAELGFWEWDLIRDEVWVKGKSRERYGIGESDVASLERLLERVHPEDRGFTRQAIQRALEGRESFEAEYRMIVPDGTTHWITARGNVERGDNGEPRRLRGVSMNITERKRAEAALRESEERFRQVADTAPVMIWMSGPDKLCHYFNKGWFNYTGRTLEQELGNGWAEGVHPDDFQRCLEIYTVSFEARRQFAMQYRLRKKDGEYGWVQDVGVPRFATDGQFLGYIGSCVDITSQKQAVDRLRESAEFNEKVLASFDSHIAILDRNGTILAVNDAWKAFSLANGVASSEVGVGVNYLEVCERAGAAGDVTVRHTLEGIRSVLNGARDFFEMEYPCDSPTASGSFLMRVVPLKTPGGGAVVTHTDISQLKQAEHEAQELRSNLAHVSRAATMNELSGSLAHELNQPLGIILSNAQAAQELLEQDQPNLPEVREILSDIVAADRRAADIIQRLRAMLRRETASFQPLSMNGLLDGVLQLARADLIARGVTVTCQLGKELPAAMGDRVQLQQVVLNLIFNAVEAMNTREPGQRRLRLVTAQLAGCVRVSVQDTGPGLPVDAGKLFEPFVTTKPTGLGMGLAICRTIITAHNGRIWAENHPEGGAIFCFEIPTVSKEVPA